MGNGIVDQTVSDQDRMFIAKEPEHYFSVGADALKLIRKACLLGNRDESSIERILDLPCGHGRVARYIKYGFPHAELTVCDLIKEGVDFCSKQFHAIPIISNQDPELIPLEKDHYDLIWVGSLFTHLEASKWPGFFAVLTRCLENGGLIVFTTSGRCIHKYMSEGLDYGVEPSRLMKQYLENGFGYEKYSYNENYGISLSSPAWVLSFLSGLPELRVCGAAEMAWDEHQDVYFAQKSVGWNPPHMARRVLINQQRLEDLEMANLTMREQILEQEREIPALEEKQRSLVEENAHLKSLVDSAYAWQQGSWLRRSLRRWKGHKRPS